jgi:hypothetical protein
MNDEDEKWPNLPQDPSWVLEQIEMGARQAGVQFQLPPAAPKLTCEEIESAVTKLLQEELARLDGRLDEKKEVPRKR